MTPAIGCSVHYVEPGTEKCCRAAILTEVHGRTVRPDTLADTDFWAASLAVLKPTGMDFRTSVVQADSGDGDTWHYPGAAAGCPQVSSRVAAAEAAIEAALTEARGSQRSWSATRTVYGPDRGQS